MSVFRSLLLSSVLLSSLAACGSAVNGNSQVILVDALPNQNKATSCTIENERGSWSVPFTPSNVSVARANGPLTVTCNSIDGWHGSVSVKSEVTASSVGGSLVNGAVVGGTLAGSGLASGGVAAVAGVGVVGGSVVADTYYGGAYVYPDSVVVPMSPTRTLPPQEAQGFPYTQQQVTPAKPVYQHKAVPVPVASSRGNS